MNDDHQINKMFVVKIESMIAEDLFSDIQRLITGLEEMLRCIEKWKQICFIHGSMNLWETGKKKTLLIN